MLFWTDDEPKTLVVCTMVYYELLPPNETINSMKYCNQLNQLKANIEEKWPELDNKKGVIFHYDNVRTRPHVSLQTKIKEGSN